MNTLTLKFVLMIIALFANLIICLPAGWILDNDFPFTIAVAGTGFISFFGIYEISINSDAKGPTAPANGVADAALSSANKLTASDRESALRHAIAGSIVLSYIVLVSITAFFKESTDTLPVLTQLLLSNFTMIVGVVIAAYFGSSAYIEGKKQNEPPKTGE